MERVDMRPEAWRTWGRAYAKGDAELTAHPERATEAWPAVTYHGKSVLEEIYKHEGALWDHVEARQGDRDLDAQECYLGYIPEHDQFVMGWDAWRYWGEFGEATTGWAYVSFFIEGAGLYGYRGSGPARVAEVRAEFDGNTFYRKGGGYDQLHKEFPTIVDLRLD